VLQIDGSYGEGGGQILRSLLALSMITGQPFTIKRIRAGRKKPGLMRQHLTAVHAAGEICHAVVHGDQVGSTELTFSPGKVVGGNYTFKIGTAGSTTLVFQTVLPALMLADSPSCVTLHGGTHNPFAPPYDFLDKVYLPVLKQMGVDVQTTLTQPGFYPAGGGIWQAIIHPTQSLKSVRLTERGDLLSHHALAYVSNLPLNIAQRELKIVARKLNWPENELEVRQITHANGPGNILMLHVQFEHASELFIGFGEPGRPSEAVANHAVQQYQQYRKGNAPVGSYLADQLLLPMALAGGGAFTCCELSRHASTQIDLLQQFMDITISTTIDHQNKSVHVRLD
jgi:RNA 3'-terminal phosphate cyclase (ATP)